MDDARVDVGDDGSPGGVRSAAAPSSRMHACADVCGEERGRTAPGSEANGGGAIPSRWARDCARDHALAVLDQLRAAAATSSPQLPPPPLRSARRAAISRCSRAQSPRGGPSAGVPSLRACALSRSAVIASSATRTCAFSAISCTSTGSGPASAPDCDPVGPPCATTGLVCTWVAAVRAVVAVGSASLLFSSASGGGAQQQQPLQQRLSARQLSSSSSSSAHASSPACATRSSEQPGRHQPGTSEHAEPAARAVLSSGSDRGRMAAWSAGGACLLLRFLKMCEGDGSLAADAPRTGLWSPKEAVGGGGGGCSSIHRARPEALVGGGARAAAG